MKIVILQLARLGDILQTLPAIQGLKKANPGAEITLVTRSTFADAARLSPHVDKLVEFPSAEILGPKAGAKALKKLGTWIAENFVAAGQYDTLINLTFSKPSAFLASLIPARKRLGIRATRDGGFVINDAWSQYFFAQILGKNMNVIHINDLFTRIVGGLENAWPLELTEPDATLPVPASNRTRIGIQLTASQPEKTLNVPTWIEVCDAILRKHAGAELVFFGAKSDLAAIEEVTAELPEGSFTVIAGQMKFHENIHWVRACKAIVSPDTALVHLASIAGTKIVEIAVGPVRPEETGPYGQGHHVLYPVTSNAAQLGEQVAQVIAGEKADIVVAHATTRFAACTSGVPRSELAPTNFDPEETGNFFSKAYYLLAEFRCAGRQEDIEIPRLGESNQPKTVDTLVNAYDALCALTRISEFGQDSCVKMLRNSDNRTVLHAEMEKLTQLEGMMATLQKTIPLVKPLIDTWSVAKDIAYSPDEGGGLVETIAVAEGSYRELGQNVEIIQQLLQTAVQEAHKTMAGKHPERAQDSARDNYKEKLNENDTN